MSSEQRLRAALDSGVAAARLPGAAVAARLPGGEGVMAAAGVRGADNPATMTVDTMFWIASCTKALTAVAAMQLVEAGKVDLDEPVSRWLPVLAAPKRLVSFSADGAPVLEPAKAPITLRRLLTHTSGLAYGFTSAEMDRYQKEQNLQLDVPGGPDAPLMFEPGEGWVYGIGIDWAGHLVEQISGETLDAYMSAHLFGPLGMNDTTFFPTDGQRARSASMHARTPDGGVAPIPFSQPMQPRFMMGGGGLYSTVADYLKFLDCMLGEGPQLLGPDALAQLLKVEVEGQHVGVLNSVQPTTSNTFDPFPGQKKGWNLGFVTNLEAGPNGRAAGSSAWAGLGNCYYWIDRQRRAAGIFCSQLLPFADAGALDAFGAFERAVYAG